MFEFLSSFSAFIVFISIGGFGLTVMVISYVFGGGDHEIEHEVDIDHELDIDHEYGGPGFFSVRILSVLVTVFGFVGAVAIEEGARTWLATLIGFGGGILLALLVLMVARFLHQSQASSNVTDRDLLGQNGTVVVGIMPDGIGRVRFAIGGVSIEKLAKSSGAKPIPENTIVRVKNIVGNLIVVE